MKYDLNNDIQKAEAKNKFNALMFKKASIELKEIKETRSAKQNNALHLYYKFISDQLNEMGQEFNYQGITGNTFSTRFTPEIIKEYTWRPIQMALFNIESTTKIDTKQINEIVEVISKFFAERGIDIEFPSIESLMR